MEPFCPELRWLHAIPNGGSRNIAEAKKMKGEGIKSGILDLFLPVARHGFYGFYIELKFKKNTLSSNQEEFKDFVEKQGYLARVYRDPVLVQDDLMWYLGINTI